MITYQDIKSGAVPAPVQQPQVRDHDLDLSEIKLDQSAQPRESLNNDRIAEYAEAMKAGDQFPPLTVFHDGTTYWLADGFHRHYAAQHAGRKHIRCYVRQGGLRDAILYSVGANAKHGLARSDEDKKRAVMRLLDDPEWGAWSDSDIRKQCKVSLSFVQKLRKETYREVSEKPAPRPSVPPELRDRFEKIEAAGGTPRLYNNRHGKVAVMDVSGINAERTLSPQEKQANALRSAWVKASPEARAMVEEITSQTVAQQGGEGGALPETPVEEITSDADREYSDLQAAWDRAGPLARRHFLAWNDLTGSNQATGMGGGDVDRSATRASSAVEVGATNSPDGADSVCVGSAARGQAAPSGECPEAPSRSAEKMVISETAAADRGAGSTPTCALTPRDDLTVGTNSNPQPNPPRDADKAETETPPTVSATPFSNPRCQHPKTCHLAHTKNECFDCNVAWSKRPKEEQVRLWDEAVQAARAA